MQTKKSQIRVITIAREYGSGGAEIGRCLAGTLGWRFMDRWLLESAARFAQVRVSTAQKYDERTESWLEQMVAGFRAPSPEIYATPASNGFFDARTMYMVTEHVIRTAAEEGKCVLIGRGAQCVLRNRQDTFHVFAYAPVEARIARIEKRLPHEANVRELMSQIDGERAAYIHQNYDCNWDDRHLYDLCVNSALGIGTAVEIVNNTIHFLAQ